MGVVQFYSKEDVFSSFKNPSSQALGKVYFAKSARLANGLAVYLDRTKTQKLTPNRWYGVKNYRGANWAFQVNSLSQIVNLQQEPTFTMGWQPMYPTSNVAATKATMTAVADKGIRFFQLNIRFNDIFKNIDEWNANTGYWSKYDELVNHANSLPFDEVFFRIICDYDDTEYYDTTANPVVPKTNYLFHLFEDIAQDEWGNPCRIADGSGHASFAKDSAVAKMVEFFDRVVARYVPILGEKFKYAAAATSAQQEMGENYENQFWSDAGLSGRHRVSFDYHPDSIAKFQDLVIKLHGSLTAAGQAHGIVYNSKADIQPPRTGKSSLTAVTSEDIYNLFRSQLGLDWYLHNYLLMKKFWLACKEKLKIRAEWAQFVGEFGSLTDELTIVRYCFDIPDIVSYVDVIKAQFSAVDWQGNALVSACIVANNVGNVPIWVEVNENDPVEYGEVTEPNQVKTALFNYAKSAYANGASNIIFIGDYSSIYFQNTMDMIDEFKTWVSQNPNYKVTDGTTIQIPITKFIQNYQGAVQDIRNAGLSTALTNRPVVKIIQNIRSNYGS